MKNIGKKLGIFTLVGFAITTGYFACQNQSLKKQKTRLEIQVESYSIRHADLDEKFREKNKQIEIYSDSLQKMQNSNKEVELENKNLGQEKKKFEDKYYALAHQFEEFKRKNLLNTLKGEKYDSLMNEFQIVFADYNKIEETSKDLEEKFNKLLEMYNEAIAEKSKTGDAEKHISSKNQSDDFALELKYNSFFRDWKSISPRFKDLSENSVIAVDNNPEGMLGNAIYKNTGRDVPLGKLQEFPKYCSFALPELENYEGIIQFYFTDKDGNVSDKTNVYVSKGKIAKKEKWLGD